MKEFDSEAVSSVRRFSRGVTRRIGVLTDRFLGRDRPLAEARLIFEIGRDGQDVRTLRERLDFDSGYLSRLLRSLEKQGLAEVVPQDFDRRIRRACLTPDGVSELAELNRRGDEFARSLLAPLPETFRVQLVQAMDKVERLLRLSSTTITLEDPTNADALWSVEQYFDELRECFEQGFDPGKSISAAPDEMIPPRGAFLVARLDGRPIGCGALKTLAPGIGTIKRMWVAKSARGIGLGQLILLALESQAKELKFDILRLETNRNLAQAQHLYRRSGYKEVPSFNEDPYAHFWFEKTL